jgi:oligosaccharide repeat unit polymerase
MIVIWAAVAGLSVPAYTTGLVFTRDGISAVSIAILLLSIVAWGVGEICASLVPYATRRAYRASAVVDGVYVNASRSRVALIVLFLLSVAGYWSFIQTWSVIDLITNPTAAGFLEWNIRIAQKEEEFGGVVGRFHVLPFVGLAFAAYLLGRKVLRRSVLWLAVFAFVFMLISPRRELLLQGIMLAVLVYQCARQETRSYLLLVLGIFSLLGLFAFTQVALNKTEAGWAGVISAVTSYVAANIPTMEWLLSTSHYEDTSVIFNVPLRVSNELLDTHYVVELDIPFADVGQDVNTVPYQYYVYRDGGMLGVLIGGLLLGFAARLTSQIAIKQPSFGLVWTKCALLIFIIFSFREFTLITYNWWFFFAVSMLVSVFVHRRGGIVSRHAQ